MNMHYARPIRIVMAALVALTACSQQQQEAQPPEQARALEEKVKQGEARRKQVEAEYRALSIPDLVQRLEEDAKRDVEPFNSLAYREVTGRAQEVSKALIPAIRTPDRTSFLTLMALRKLSLDGYQSLDVTLRGRILVDALRTAKHFNAFGIPHQHWEQSGRAIIELGQPVVSLLRPLLEDKRSAPLWGSEEVAEFQRYQYRVCDYAWALIAEILNRKSVIPADPSARDQQIAALVKELR